MATDQFDELDEQSGLPAFLFDPRGVLRRRWPWMLAVLVVSSIAAASLLAGLPQTFEASARLLLTRQRISEEFVRPTSLERVPELVNAIIGEILSRESLAGVATAQNLPERMSLDGSMADLVEQMHDAITVEPDEGLAGQRQRRDPNQDTLVLAIRYQSADPAVAADVANELASRFTAAHLRRQSHLAKMTSDFLRREAERAGEELKEQRALLTEFKQQHRGQLPSELGTKLARLERLQQQNQTLALQISDAEGRLLILQGQETALNTREVALDELRSRLAQERTIYTAEAPHVVAIQEQIEALQKELGGERTGASAAPASSDPAVRAVQREVNALRAQARAVEQEMRALDGAVAAIPARQEELLALEQRHQLLQERFNDATRKLQEAELSENLQRAQQGFRVFQLDVAVPPPQPMRSRWRLAIVAVGAVFAASILAGLVLELVDPVILTSRQLETQTGAIPLGAVPTIR